MKNRGNPRLVCRVARFRDAIFGHGPDSHVARCPDCQAYLRADAVLADSLRAAAPESPAPEETRLLAERIALSVRRAEPEPRRGLGLLGAAAGAAAVFIVTFTLVRVQPTTGGAAVSQAPVDVRQMVVDVDAVRAQWLQNVGPSAKKIARDNPLSQELVSVRHDARSAVNFIAMNFIPMDTPGSQMPGNGPGGY